MAVPDLLGRYVVHRRIGSGGFATVWLAYDEQLDSPVAVKVLADNWTEDDHVRRRFVAEGRYLRRVESPHVVTVYDAGELDDGRPYLVMTYADQGTLADRLRDDRQLTTAQALAIIGQVADGLQALHDRDILHRDVKPANVLFRTIRNGADVRAMLGDLGLGKALDMSSRLTLIAGTPSYVAPEQAAAEPLGPHADQYSLAALSYLLLTGRQPFRHDNLRAAADPGPVPPMSADEQPFAREVEAVVRRGLARAPDDRYPTVTAFADALAGALRESAGVAPAVTTPGRPWLPLADQPTLPGGRPIGVTSRPSAPAAPATDDQEPPVPPRPRANHWRRAALVLVALVAAAGAGVSAYAWGRDHAGSSGSVVLTDGTGSLQVTVPTSWKRYVSRDGWTPPHGAGDPAKKYPALWVGTTEHWNDVDVRADGVFLALLPSDQLPGHLPRHPGCAAHPQVVGKDPQGRDQATARYTGCPGGVVIEQATMLPRHRLLWVQVHAGSTAGANAVLRTVETRGL